MTSNVGWSDLRQAFREHSGLFLAQGIVLVIAGGIAVLLPQVATLAVSIFLGWLLLIVGVVEFILTLRHREVPGFWGLLLLSALVAILGALLVFRPLAGVITLTIALVAYFIAHGVASLYLTFKLPMSTGRQTWMVLGAVLDFALAGLIIAGWPSTATWILGLYVGIQMLFAGFAMIFAALEARSSDATV